jgi:uncharacterized membrane protein
MGRSSFSTREQVEKHFVGMWEHHFGLVEAPFWDQLFETVSPLLIEGHIQAVAAALKKGKLGKSHALVTFKKKLAEHQQLEFELFAVLLSQKTN